MKGIYTGLLLAHVVVSAAPSIVSYRAEIHDRTGNKVAVDIAISTGANVWQKPVHTIERGGGERVSGIGLVSSDGRAVSSRVERVGLLDRIVCNEPVWDYRIHYVVEANDPGPARIPLAVPEIPTGGAAGSVTVTFYPASQEVILGDTFPAFQRDGAGLFVAELSNVPNHVQLASWRTGEAGFRERWVTPATLSDLVVIALLVIGSITRAIMRRKQEA